MMSLITCRKYGAIKTSSREISPETGCIEISQRRFPAEVRQCDETVWKLIRY